MNPKNPAGSAFVSRCEAVGMLSELLSPWQADGQAKAQDNPEANG